jgi:hypothetical protein
VQRNGEPREPSICKEFTGFQGRQPSVCNIFGAVRRCHGQIRMELVRMDEHIYSYKNLQPQKDVKRRAPSCFIHSLAAVKLEHQGFVAVSATCNVRHLGAKE